MDHLVVYQVVVPICFGASDKSDKRFPEQSRKQAVHHDEYETDD